jgi:hypothetical protein
VDGLSEMLRRLGASQVGMPIHHALNHADRRRGDHGAVAAMHEPDWHVCDRRPPAVLKPPCEV